MLFIECNCDEARLGRYTPNQRIKRWQFAHDCDYVRQRNSCIPEAERIAMRDTLHLENGPDKDRAWSRAFLTAMEELVEERLRS